MPHPNPARTFLAWLVLAGLVIAPGSAAGAETVRWTKLEVFPASVSLSSSVDTQSLVVQATRDDGITCDATAHAQFELVDAKVAHLDGPLLRPSADGTTTLKVRFEGQSVEVPVQVNGSGVTPPLSFRLDIMPVFMRAGCNTGSCHGAARGKDGFRLSLFGFDPQGDHFRLTREMSGRRLNLAVPADSLVLEKATGAVQHTGGKRFEPGSPMYQTLLSWIERGGIE